jgi:hypothetical protein
MYKPLLYLINIIHICIVLFVVIIPFLNSNYFLLLHLIIVPFIILHWATNNNTCALTVAEYYITELVTGKPVNKSKTFFGRLIEPVYDFNKNNQDESIFLYIVTIGLVSLSIGKLIRKKYTGEIKTFWDLFRR